MRIALVSDAWRPQVNGVVRTLAAVTDIARARGHRVGMITPDRFRSVAMPNYPEIRLALASPRAVGAMIDELAPDAIHIATEGPLGWAARRWCLTRGLDFTTSFHTRFPDYIAARTGLPPALLWRPLRRFHRAARHILVATPRLAAELADNGLPQTLPWTRGVDSALFHAGRAPHPAFADLPRPIAVAVGRVAVEKNLEAFLTADWPGTRVVVGDGPALAELRARFPDAVFTGGLHGEGLAAAYAGADISVFPSRTDTFGLVIIESLASGTPVAGFPVPGPLDILGPEGRGDGVAVVGGVSDDLAAAMRAALTARRSDCAAYGATFSWDRSCDQFLAALAPITEDGRAEAA
jgi:glycosyltransferase involved in cell wall biosynthesis